MQLSPLPDLSSNRRLIWTAVLVTLVVSMVLAIHDNDLTKALGDTDDAMRLVLVRDLMAGRGWWDQLVPRLQPPLGSYMHWSRLVDGGLAATAWVFGRFVSPPAAEIGVRLVWPLLWIFPAVLSALVIARGLAGRAAVFICAVLLMTNVQLYTQFRPGRVDHHNIQIVMTLIAAACAVAKENRARWAAFAGLAAGLGLAIGIEALAFQALIGASFAVRAGLDPAESRPARSYGLALTAATLGFYALQTPPWRWSLSVCDAIGFNLVAAIALGGLGLAALASCGGSLTRSGRFAVLAGIGLVAVGVYLALAPACLHGPFAAVDPRLRPFWFDHIRELQSWPQMLGQDRGVAIRSITMALMGLASAGVLLVRQRRGPESATLLVSACVGLAAFAAAHALRMQDYAFWFGVPALAAAISLVTVGALRNLLLPTLAASLVASPICLGVLLTLLADLAPRPAVATAVRGVDEHCFDTANYAPLAALPPGVVLAEIDLGPFILANTRDSVLAAPYHRMSWGILAAHDAQNAGPVIAEAEVRALNVAYLLECPSNPLRAGPASLEAELRAGRAPAWLQPLSKTGQILQIYRVRPPAQFSARRP